MYTEYAKFYDTLYEGKRIDTAGIWQDDKQFWFNQAKEAGSPILELGCGSGRLAIPIAELGLTIHGIDNSPEMLDILARKWRKSPVCHTQHLSWELGSMEQKGNFPKNLRLIFAPASILQYLYNKTDQERVFSNAFSSLMEGGKFIVDVFNPNPESISQWGEKILMKQVQSPTDRGVEITWYCIPKSADKQTRILYMPSNFLFKSSIGSEELTLPAKYYCFSEDELATLFLNSGFKHISVCGGYNFEPFSKNSRRIIMTGVK